MIDRHIVHKLIGTILNRNCNMYGLLTAPRVNVSHGLIRVVCHSCQTSSTTWLHAQITSLCVRARVHKIYLNKNLSLSLSFTDPHACT
jgi:hypothetical protein